MVLRTASLLPLLLAASVAAQGRNLLFYGNSFTYYSWGYGVPELVQKIAVAAGHPSPTIVSALVGGVTLQYHATDPGQIAVIGSSLPAGQHWDEVVIQGHVLEATPEGGHDPAVFRANAVAITGNVRSHSPAARAVMFQTWASAWGSPHYPMPWARPIDMHDVIRGNYRLAVADIRAAFGAGAAANSAVGDGVGLLEWDPAWYEADLSHPNPAMILLAAMSIYTSIYGQTVCGIHPVFQPADPLALSLASQGLGEADWNFLAGLADRVADPAVRPFAGSGDHLLLETATGSAALTACPTQQMTTGTLVQVQLRSMNGVFDNAWGWLLADLFQTGSPPGPWPTYPEIRIDLPSMVLLATSTTLTSPMTFSIQVPVSLPGSSFLVQGFAWRASTETGNPWFTTTDARELVFH
ncbi:MAG: hypothetical protein KDE27_07105 [Planctomycetes bacterium]|nr:hypothetical protein [Planctomycetota bacterium]